MLNQTEVFLAFVSGFSPFLIIDTKSLVFFVSLQVIVLTFVFMFAFAVLIWFGRGENPIDSSLLTRVG